ncbi:hypothetical protein [Nonomuraea basaltis]|uniref:hypothetical protein n=1 Tax=Nonomuraea basaltis TaxID=2495887 RepID=UPI00110C6523|nr:hypothetical protein [Nonomuraea basaltis]TMR94649.1 hypothetical protein EJK15_32925 [Nonomuraea basaltis]
MRKPMHKYAASFDSATGMLRALSRYLRGRDVPMLGQLPGAVEPLVSGALGAANRLPRGLAERAYAMAGWTEASAPAKLAELRSDPLAEWIVGHYPRRRYPVVFAGSASGALVHLAAALGAPWLPQTLLLPVRQRGGHPDAPRDSLRLVRPAGEAMLAANPDLVLHHMHDANQDRLMIGGMSYFRIKWRRLPRAYRDFLQDCLAPGGTLVISDCGLRWPTTRIGERYVFQHGALGGLTPGEYRTGTPEIARYLARHGSPYRHWDAPEPDGDGPEAEWGFEPELLDDLREAAPRTAQLSFADPEALSPAVADLYRSWYDKRGLPGDRLLAESFVLLEPWWTLRTGSVPFWMVFNGERSRQALLSYLDRSEPFDEIRLTLFSHGVESPGIAPIDAWREALGRAGKIGVFAGVDPRAFPRDFAVFARTHRDLTRMRTTYPMPLAMPLPETEDALVAREDVTWTVEGTV